MICAMVYKSKKFYVILLITIMLICLNCDYELSGWNKKSIRNISYYMKENLRKIVPDNFCKSEPMLLIIVTSAPANKDARQAIRETWGNEKNTVGQEIAVTFFVGNSLKTSIEDEILQESLQFGDIIQEKFIDTYYNLTLKSFFVIKTAADNCNGKGQFLLKIDDDMFLQIPKLLEIINSKNYSNNVLIGKKTCKNTPIKNPLSKWYCPSYMYNKTTYPDFLSGTAYLMSMDVTRKLYNAALITPLLHLEDVYFTGICAKHAGILPEYNPKFTTSFLQDEPCDLADLITMHQFSPDKIRQTFKTLNNSEILKKCDKYQPMFNVQNWMKSTLFTPFSRSKRKRICD